MASKDLAKLKENEARLGKQYLFVIAPTNPNNKDGNWSLRMAMKPKGKQWSEVGTKKGSKAEVTQFAATKRDQMLRRGVPASNIKIKIMS